MGREYGCYAEKGKRVWFYDIYGLSSGRGIFYWFVFNRKLCSLLFLVVSLFWGLGCPYVDLVRYGIESANL